MKQYTDHMTGIVSLLPPLGAMLLLMKPLNPKDPGQATAQMRGMLAPQGTTIGVITSLFPTQELTKSPAQQSCSCNIARSLS